MNILLVMFIIFLDINAIHLATLLIFGIFAHTYISNPLYRAKNQAAAHGGGLFRVQKRCYAL